MNYKINISDTYKINKSKKNIIEILENNWISSAGKNVKKFEKIFSKYIGTKYAISMSNGTSALISALAYKIKRGDKVAVTALTFGACANAIVSIGAEPIFIDTYKDNWMMSLKDLKEKFKKDKFKAIINVHLNGYSTEIDKIKKFCKKNKIFLIEDCAEALGTTFNKKKVGTFGDIGTFSFFANKTITTGEGGMCVTNNKKIDKKLRILRDHGMHPKKKYWHIENGFNHRLTNIQATIGINQIKLINEIIKKRKFNFKQYLNFFNKKNYFQNIPHHKHCDPVMWYFPITLKYKHKNKKKGLINYLNQNKIETRNFFYPLDRMKIFSKRSFCVNSETLSKRSFYLPLHPNLSVKDITLICEKVDKFFK